MPVLGIGGLFFRARDPEAMGRWYREHLGVGAGCAAPGMTAEEWVWTTGGGPVVFQPFTEDDAYFAPDRRYMLNLRVTELEALTAQLEQAGIAVTTKPEWNSPEIGRFARVHDPEGNPIELWEPPASD